MSHANARVAAISVGLVIAMGALAWASVPAYRLICQQLGFGGTPQVNTAAARVGTQAQEMTVRFNADTANGLNWRFKPVQASVTLPIGATGLAYYEAVNMSDRVVTGTATFNVTPLQAAKYFVKVDCFCFTEQTLGPGERADMPVSFYIDPEVLDDPAFADLETVTLSYTFFETRESRSAAGDSVAATGLEN